MSKLSLELIFSVNIGFSPFRYIHHGDILLIVEEVDGPYEGIEPLILDEDGEYYQFLVYQGGKLIKEQYACVPPSDIYLLSTDKVLASRREFILLDLSGDTISAVQRSPLGCESPFDIPWCTYNLVLSEFQVINETLFYIQVYRDKDQLILFEENCTIGAKRVVQGLFASSGIERLPVPSRDNVRRVALVPFERPFLLILPEEEEPLIYLQYIDESTYRILRNENLRVRLRSRHVIVALRNNILIVDRYPFEITEHEVIEYEPLDKDTEGLTSSIVYNSIAVIEEDGDSMKISAYKVPGATVGELTKSCMKRK